MRSKLRPVVPIHGGKYYLASWVISHFPVNYADLIYVEPFCGGASVLLQKVPGKQEIINDIDDNLICLLNYVKRDVGTLISYLSSLSYSESTFLFFRDANFGPFSLPIYKALKTYVVHRMSRGSSGTHFSWSSRLRGGQPEGINAWESGIKQLPLASHRLERVTLHNLDFAAIFQLYDSPNTLFYCDPPYLLHPKPSRSGYRHPMTVSQHEELAKVLNKILGKAILSGYWSPEYEKWYSNWKVDIKEMPNHAAQTRRKQRKTEYLWWNF